MFDRGVFGQPVDELATYHNGVIIFSYSMFDHQLIHFTGDAKKGAGLFKVRNHENRGCAGD